MIGWTPFTMQSQGSRAVYIEWMEKNCHRLATTDGINRNQAFLIWTSYRYTGDRRVLQSLFRTWPCLSANVSWSTVSLSASDVLVVTKKWFRLQLGRKVESTMAVHRGSFPSTTVQTAANVVSQFSDRGGWCIAIQIQTRLGCGGGIAWTTIKTKTKSWLVNVLTPTSQLTLRQRMNRRRMQLH